MKSFIVKFITIMSTITVVIFLMITHNFHTGYDITSKYTPLINAAMEIKLEATTAHLWFEEIMSGDRDEDIKDVLKNIDNAIWYANAMIHGGSNSAGILHPLQDKRMIEKINNVLQKLNEFKQITNTRYSNFLKSGAGSMIDKKYDFFFRSFIKEADDVKNTLQEIIASDLQAYKRVYFITIIILLIFISIVSVVLYRYEKRIKELSIKDKLTGLYNRLYIENVFEKELKRAKRYKNNFSIIFVDIDYFKEVNDTYGHDVGDAVLKIVANILKSNIRSLDTIARWGGEEFIILCPETDVKSAEKVAQKLRKSVESHNIKIDEHKVCTIVGHKTCSFGISEYTTDDELVKHILKRADDALYEAKSNGRNRVVCR